MTTVSSVIEQARWHVLNGRREMAGSLLTDMTADPTTIAVALPLAIPGLTRGHILEIGLELMQVTAYTPGALSIAVVRGYGGTQAAAHYAGAPIIVNPVVPSWIILEKINAVLRMVSAPFNGLYRMLTVDIDTGAGKYGYDLPVIADFHDVWAARWRVDNIGRYRKIDGSWAIMRDAPTSDFPSGIGIVFDQPPGPYTTRLWYRAGFGELVDWAEDVEAATGFPSTGIDILALGAAILAVEGREISRADMVAQPDTRRAEEVGIGGATNSTTRLQRRYDSRLIEEAQRFIDRWEWVRQ